MMNVPYSRLPESPGVYIMKDGHSRILYIGKAGSLKRRVSSYFLRPHDHKTQKLVSEIKSIDYKKTDTALEALILEAKLIKKYEPPYNVREKDDKSFLFVEITEDKFPRVLLVRGKTEAKGERFGPFTSASSIRQALRILRKIFPFNIHPADRIGKFPRGCFDYEIGLCPGTCINAISRSDYLKNIRHIKLFFRGKKEKLLKTLKSEMRSASKKLEFEKAEKLRRQIFALQHIQDIAFITEPAHLEMPQLSIRMEGYDISNISGTSAVGAMVVFMGGRPAKNEYRRFKVRTVAQSDDVGMLREVLARRFNNSWPLPDLILVDGGKPQVNVTYAVLDDFGLRIPVVGIAKGPKRKKNEFIGRIPFSASKKDLIRLRNEAHRFAISYHKKLRTKNTFSGVFLL